MSDHYGQDSGTTQVMPVAPPTAPPQTPGTAGAGPAPGGRGGVPWWVVVIVALVVALLVGGAAMLFAGQGTSGIAPEVDRLTKENAELKTRVDELTAQAASATAAGPASAPVAGSAPATSAEEPPAAAPSSPTLDRQFCLVKKVTWSSGTGYRLTADYEQLLTGAAAESAAAAHGDTIEGESFYIVNDNTKLRTFTLANDADVRVLNWGDATGIEATNIPVGQFMDIMPGGTNPQEPWKDAHYWITVKDGTTVVKVEHQYFP